ncbi:MAG: rRNA pseudouridine synthase [Clostridia bacterium]|nr:rRNA pseudouridine synthase [Clostridia bacterium]
MEEIRLQKYISTIGVMSRRAAEKEIEAGRIRVNGEVADLGQKIIPGKDRVTYKGKLLEQKKNDRKVYIMLNKPKGYVTTLSDDKERKCVAQLVEDVNTRVYPVGRLDMYSEGLLLFTNDGELANKLTHPKHHIPKIYHVKLKGEITPEQLKALSKPMVIDDYEIQPVKCEIITRRDNFTVIRMELYEGRNRQIRKMCEQTELEIIKLQRVAIGNIKLGDLAPGKWRHLTKTQVDYLMKS